MTRRSVAFVLSLLLPAALWGGWRTAKPNAAIQHFLFFSARRCSTAAQGCSLGAALGGIDAANNAVAHHRASGRVAVFWAGKTFRCTSSDGSEVADVLSAAAKAQQVSGIGVSYNDAQQSLETLQTLAKQIRSPWILTNGTRRDGPNPWTSYADVPLVNGTTARVFAIAMGSHAVTNASLYLADPLVTLHQALAASPPGRVNVVLVSTDQRGLLAQIAAIPTVHVVFDGEEAAPEPYTADETPEGALRLGVRGDGQALFRLSFRPSGPFGRWEYFRDSGTSLPGGTAIATRWSYMSAVELLTR